MAKAKLRLRAPISGDAEEIAEVFGWLATALPGLPADALDWFTGHGPEPGWLGVLTGSDDPERADLARLRRLRDDLATEAQHRRGDDRWRAVVHDGEAALAVTVHGRRPDGGWSELAIEPEPIQTEDETENETMFSVPVRLTTDPSSPREAGTVRSDEVLVELTTHAPGIRVGLTSEDGQRYGPTLVTPAGDRRWRLEAPDLEVRGEAATLRRMEAEVTIGSTVRMDLVVGVDVATTSWRIALAGWPLVRWYAGRYLGRNVAVRIDQMTSSPRWRQLVGHVRAQR